MIRFILGLFFLHSFISLGQDSNRDSLNGTESHYFNTTYGLLRSSYRDQPTSPLFYNGYGIHFAIGSTDESDIRVANFKSSVNLSMNSAKLPTTNSLSTNYSSIYLNIPFYYDHLRKIHRWDYKEYNILIGGAFLTTINSRLNSALFNASAGFDIESSFMFSSKIEKDISRKKTKKVKLWLIKKELQPKKRTIGFQFNTGILNFNYRPNYTNLSESEIDGSNTNWVKFALDGYRVSWNGWNLNSQIDLTFHKKNGNRIKWAYEWSASHVPGRYEPLDFSFHQLHLTLMFKR